MRPVDTLFGRAVPKPAPQADPVAGVITGRGRHDEKITVYWSSAELAALDAYRLELRGKGIRVDRGMLIRAAAALAFAHPDEWTALLSPDEAVS